MKKFVIWRENIMTSGKINFIKEMVGISVIFTESNVHKTDSP